MELSAGGRRPGGPGRRGALAAWGAIVVAAVALATLLSGALDLRPAANEYNLAAWESRHLLNKWLYLFGEAFRAGRTLAQEDADLAAFLAAVGDVSQAERSGDATGLEDAIRRRDRFENRAEATIEGRITRVAEREGLTRGLFILPDIVWPPVDTEFTAPPRTLAISPRDRIELMGTTLLREGLDLPEIDRIEASREARGAVAALTFPVAGVGAYPTIVTHTSSYRGAVEVAAHEWVHNYLVFRPLGIRYYESNDLRTMNETVADLVGREIADAVLAAWPLAEPPSPPSADPSTETARAPAFDAHAELVKLRGEVDVLLAADKIEEAESLMEERRQSFAAQGFFLRRINQAYFAFVNLYAGEGGSPGAVNPIGPKIDELRRRSGSLAEFMSIAGGLTSVADLDDALAQTDGG